MIAKNEDWAESRPLPALLKGIQERLETSLRRVIEEAQAELAKSQEARATGNSPLTLAQVQVDGFLFVLTRTMAVESESLTHRELEIARLVREGLPNKLIAAQLGISAFTVAAHLRRIFDKLKIDSRYSLVRQPFVS